MINFITYQKITNWKNLRKKIPIEEKLVILKMLDRGLYAQEITQKYSFSARKLSQMIKSFKSRNLIEQYQTYPKRYRLTNIGKLILEHGDLNQKRISEFITGKRISSKWIDRIRVHKLRFKSKLIQKPSWLNKIRDKGNMNGLTIKRVELNNWTKFLIYFNYQDFNGLENIEICNNVIIYNFNRNIEDQYISTKEGLDEYLEGCIKDCKNVKEFIQQQGFVFDNSDPKFCQKPHFAIETRGDPKTLGSLGAIANITIKKSDEMREIDDSPGKGEGEEETDNIDKAKAMFDVPQNIEDIKAEISGLKETMADIFKGVRDEMKEGIAEGMKEFLAIFKNIGKLTEQQERLTEIETDSGGMFQ